MFSNRNSTRNGFIFVSGLSFQVGIIKGFRIFNSDSKAFYFYNVPASTELIFCVCVGQSVYSDLATRLFVT